LAVLAAVAVAYVRGSLTDRVIMVIITLALSISFLVYIIVGQWLFSFKLGWFPVQGWSDSTFTNLLVYAPLPVFLAVLVGLAPRQDFARSPGVWAQAWLRLKEDRVGVVCLWIVGAFLILVALAAADLVSSGWQVESGVPYAPPHLLGKQADAALARAAEGPAGPNTDLSAVDPLAPRYREWEERAARLKTSEPPKADTLPLGADRLGRDVLAKAIEG